MLHNERQQRYKRVQRSLAAAIGFSFCLLVNKTPWCKQVFTSCVCKQNSVDGAIAKTCDSCVPAMGWMRDKGNVGKMNEILFESMHLGHATDVYRSDT